MSHYKPYPAYKDSGVEWLGEVPEHWAVIPCRAFVDDQTAKNDDGSKENYLSLMANIGIIPYEKKGDVGNKKPEDLTKCKLVSKGDFVINSMNYGIGSYGLSSLDGVCSPVYIVLRPRLDIVESRFAFRLFENRSFQLYAQSFGNGILEHRAAINWDILKGINVGIPAENEQRAILSFLDRETAKIDTLISKQEKLIELLKEKRQAVISHAVTKGLNPKAKMKDSGVGWLGEVPEHWESRKISHAFERIGSGTTPPTGQDEWYLGSEIPWITTGELRETVITETSKYVTTKALEEFSTLRLYPAGSLAMAMYGATIGRLGILGVPATTNQACCVLSGEINLSIHFAYFWFLAFKQQIIDLYAAGGGQPNINQEVIANLRVPAPTIADQTAIAAFLDRETSKIDTLISKSEKAIELQKEHRTALISAAVTGKIDVRGAV